jgi:hypothetical protein
MLLLTLTAESPSGVTTLIPSFGCRDRIVSGTELFGIDMGSAGADAELLREPRREGASPLVVDGVSEVRRMAAVDMCAVGDPMLCVRLVGFDGACYWIA